MAEIKSINNMPLCDQTARDGVERVADELNNYVTKAELDETIDKIEVGDIDLDGYATKDYVDDAIAGIEINGGDIDLSDYVTKDELNNKADADHTHDGYLTAVPDEYITESELSEAIAGIEIPDTDLSAYVTKENPEMTGSLSLNRSPNSEIGDFSVAEGYYCTASGMLSHAEGSSTTASGYVSHTEGVSTTASGSCSHAEGSDTIASGEYSHAEGYFTIAKGEYQHVQGKFNEPDYNNKYAHIVGNGYVNEETGTQFRSNAYTLDWDGNAWFAGNVTIGADNKELATQEYVNNILGDIESLLGGI